jgi:hypothetical protein
MPMYLNSCNLRNVLLKNQPSIQNRLKVFHLVKLKLKYVLDRSGLKSSFLTLNNKFNPKRIKFISRLSSNTAGVEASVLGCNNIKIYIKEVMLDKPEIESIRTQYDCTITDNSLIIDFNNYPFYEQNYRSALNFLNKIKIK